METIITTIVVVCLYTFLGSAVYQICNGQTDIDPDVCVGIGCFWPVAVPLSLFIWLGKKVVDKIL